MKGALPSSLAGTVRYEFTMQLRRKALWIAFVVFGLVLIALSGLTIIPWSRESEGFPVSAVVANWSLAVQVFYPLVFGLLLADRLPRDRRTGTLELLDTLPASPGGRLLGKYLGATTATLVPLVVIYAAGIVYIAVSRGEMSALVLAVAAFATINLPGLLFVAAFSISCTSVLWVPIYQFLFVGYWFWGNLISPTALPTLTGTLLWPLGEYMARGFFGTEYSTTEITANATAVEGIASMALLLGCAAVALFAAHRYMTWQRERS